MVMWGAATRGGIGVTYTLAVEGGVGWDVIASLLAFAFFIALLAAIPPAVLAYGLFRNREWVKLPGAIIAAFLLFLFPLGTAIGAYTLWFLFSPPIIVSERRKVSSVADTFR